MSIQKTLVAGVVALTALAAGAPAQAGSLTFGIYGEHGGVTFRSGDDYRPVPVHDWRDWRRYDRRWDYGYYRMTPRQVRRSLRRRGFDHIRFIDNRGRIYRATARSPRGGRVVLTIRSRDAEIVDLRRIRRHR